MKVPSSKRIGREAVTSGGLMKKPSTARRNKDRLYAALHYHEREDCYEWSLLRSPKTAAPNDTASTMQYLVKKKLRMHGEELAVVWEYQGLPLSKTENAKLLAKVLFAKVDADWEAFEECMRKVKIEQDDAEWTCAEWLGAVLEQLANDKILSKSSITDWNRIKAESVEYAQLKEEEGRFVNEYTTTVPTYDLLNGFEIVP